MEVKSGWSLGEKIKGFILLCSSNYESLKALNISRFFEI